MKCLVTTLFRRKIRATNRPIQAYWYLLMAFGFPCDGNAQQFNGDNQWVAPHGVATLVGTVGEEYSQAYLGEV